jgi:hypothetical protein
MLIQRVVALIVLLGSLSLGQAPARAETVSFLNITGGTFAFNLGSFGTITGAFTESGTVLMGQYQYSILPPFAASGYTFSLFTNPGPDPTPIPAPTGQVTGTTISVNLSSLFTAIAGPPGAPLSGYYLNIGNHPSSPATGTFNPETGAFHISWIRLYNSGLPPLFTGVDFTLNGSILPAAVPLPAGVVLMGTGLAALIALARRRSLGPPVSSG